MTVEDAVRDRCTGLIGRALIKCAANRPIAAIKALEEVIYHLRGQADERCSHCGKPASFTGPCTWGGCPLGADL